jgi:hypothetical protein
MLDPDAQAELLRRLAEAAARHDLRVAPVGSQRTRRSGHRLMIAGMSGRIVYSTETGRICPGCGWPARDCKCSKGAATESVPARVTAKLRVRRQGRSGKTVTVVDGLPRNAAFLG